jgi:trans-aconitate methyltransferase
VLDIGTGTGIWAHEFAEQYPLAQVTGTDLSLIQTAPRTPNCQFVLENSETADWIHLEPYDYVHLRSIGPCFQDVRTVIRKAYDSMAPGGWIEFQDGLWELQSMDGSIEGTDIKRWMQLVVKGGAMMGQDMTKTKRLKKQLLAAGFVNVVEHIYPIPFGPWARDRTLKEVSLYAGTSLLAALEGYRKVLKVVGLSQTEIDGLVNGARRDIHDLSIHSFMLM